MTNRHPAQRAAGGLLAMFVPAVAMAETWTVCSDGTCDFTVIQAAVDASASGDVIEIAAETFLLDAPVAWFGKDITLRGAVDAEGRPATVLDGQGLTQVLSPLWVGADAAIENLRIANGSADYGGGVQTFATDCAFRNCVFEANDATFQGGAVFLHDSAPMLVDCTFVGNTGGTAGGAIFFALSEPQFVRCTFSDNTSDFVGGALFVGDGSSATIRSTRVCANASPDEQQIATQGSGTWIDDGGNCISSDCAKCPDAPSCPADLDADGTVGVGDLLVVLSTWGTCTGCPPDLDGDGAVGLLDLIAVLASWGPCA